MRIVSTKEFNNRNGDKWHMTIYDMRNDNYSFNIYDNLGFCHFKEICYIPELLETAFFKHINLIAIKQDEFITNFLNEMK